MIMVRVPAAVQLGRGVGPPALAPSLVHSVMLPLKQDQAKGIVWSGKGTRDHPPLGLPR